MAATAPDELALLRAKFASRWEILHAGDGWHAVRRDPRPALQGLRAYTARGLLHDLVRVEGANR